MPKLKSEIRKDYFLNKYVIVTPGRAKRPRDTKEETVIKRTKSCPFCPENIDENNIIDRIDNKNKDWKVLCIGNIFPAVSFNNPKAYGTQEVIVENQNHQKELADLSEKQLMDVLEMYSKRTIALSKDKKIDYILCFKNQGSKAGASIVHAHSQVFASEILPPDIQDEFNQVHAYKNEHKTCPYCDIIKKESRSKRKIFNDKNIIAFTPYASQYHYEAWIMPKKHIDNITKLSLEDKKSFAKALKIILGKLRKLDLSFNFFMHQVISNHDQHFYLKIQPRDSIWAGVELGSGLVINSVSPEEAAKFYQGK